MRIYIGTMHARVCVYEVIRKPVLVYATQYILLFIVFVAVAQTTLNFGLNFVDPDISFHFGLYLNTSWLDERAKTCIV